MLRPRTLVRPALPAIAVVVLVASLATATLAEEISFNRDVRPILSDRCFHCHGPDADNQDSEFRLDSRENATANLGGYAGIVPGDLNASELHARIRSEDDDRMPPEDAVRQLTEEERDILDAWIEAGAPFEPHWSFIAPPATVKVPDSGGDWARTEIDHFIHREIASAGMQPNAELSKDKWLRRVTFDLTGLPPTLAEIEVFCSDESQEAHAAAVDRLLASPACAERLATEWLDVARYSDTYGYQRDDARFVWPYRDWVISAFQKNMPYDQFVTWQLAGDLLPNATREQRLATTFNRLHSHKKEGGSPIEEFRVEMVSDRAHTFSAAFMGLTMECAHCHDHKYDPTKTKEYYQLSSFFANVDERGLISYFTPAVPTPAMPLPSKEQEADLALATDALAKAELKVEQAWSQEQSVFHDWLAGDAAAKGWSDSSLLDEMPGLIASLSFERLEEPIAKLEEAEEAATAAKARAKIGQRELADAVRDDHPATTSDKNALVLGHEGQAIQLTGDDPVVLPAVGHFRRHDPFSFSVWINAKELAERSVIYRRSRGWDDAGSVGYELTREGDRLSAKICHFWPGNAIAVETTEPLEMDRWYHIAVTYDGSSRAAGLKIYVDGNSENTAVVKDHLTRNISEWEGGEDDLAIGSRYRDRGFKDGLVDEFRVFDRELSAIEVQRLGGAKVRASEAAVAQYYRLAASEKMQEANAALREAREDWNDAMDAIPAIMVMRELDQPRKAFVLNRGGYDDRGEEVTADTPAFLPPFPIGAPRNRLGLAQWITDPNHPLMARVTVNRYWQLVFGEGLVRTPEDFGLQGELPTNPELLDWLSRHFVKSSWDVRALLRTMVLSSTYRQSSVVTKKVRDQDPENRLFSRGPSQRLSAEMVRDNALAVSGLLVNKVGGEPVKPYDLPLAYNPLAADEGEGLYRRSLYTYWKRTSPAPVMMTMNANKREVCRLHREVTSSPLQALVLLNGPQFIEASRVLADRLLEKHGDDAESLIGEAFALLTSRPPTDDEADVLRELWEEQLRLFKESPEQAVELLETGDAKSNGQLSPTRQAATTVLVNAIMNLDECVRLK